MNSDTTRTTVDLSKTRGGDIAETRSGTRAEIEAIGQIPGHRGLFLRGSYFTKKKTESDISLKKSALWHVVTGHLADDKVGDYDLVKITFKAPR